MQNTQYDIALIGTHFLAQALKKYLNQKGFLVALLETFNHEESCFEFFYGLENTEEQKQAIINFESALDCQFFNSQDKLSVNILEQKDQKISPLWKSYQKDKQVISLDGLMAWTAKQRELNQLDTFTLIQEKKEKNQFKLSLFGEVKEITAKNLIALNSLQNLDTFFKVDPQMFAFSKSLKPFLYTAVNLKLSHSNNVQKCTTGSDLHIFQNKNFHHCIGRFKNKQSYWTCFIPYEDFEYDSKLSIKAIHYLKNKIKTIYPTLLSDIVSEKIIVEPSLYSNKFFKGFSDKKIKSLLDNQNFINQNCKQEDKNLFFSLSSKLYPNKALPALWSSFTAATKLVYGDKAQANPLQT